MKNAIKMTGAIGVLALSSLALQAPAVAQSTVMSTVTESIDAPAVLSDARKTAYTYLLVFYPRWFTSLQALSASSNQIVGPDKMGPQFKSVVAVNDDTLYASTFLDVTQQPVIVTIPVTTDVFSVLHLDQYGKAFQGIPSRAPGVYALTGPDWQGTLPSGVTPVRLPYKQSILMFRADKYAASGMDMQQQAAQFRQGLHAAPLSDYLSHPDAGAAKILPVTRYGISLKLLADSALGTMFGTKAFLTSLQWMVGAASTQPLTPSEQALARAFNAAANNVFLQGELIAGAKAAYADMVSNYKSHTLGDSHWIHFDNLAAWDASFQAYMDRASIAEFLELANNRAAAAYFHTFVDQHGQTLDGTAQNYTLTFPKGGTPSVSRFWSLTAYTPDAIELVPNGLSKYVVASYSPGLKQNPDGSITIVMSATQPANVPQANWLPVPTGPFNVMLRAYGPQGPVQEGTYVPPPVVSP